MAVPSTSRAPVAIDAPGAPSPALAPPQGNPRFPLFDGLRGVAVLGVLALHASELSARVGIGVGGRLAEVAGAEGVIVFFVISGFLLYRPYAAARAEGRPGPSVRRYARRRVLRILPGYWILMTLLAVFPGVAGIFSGDWWRYYGYLQLYSTRTMNGGIPVAWTLCVEVTFYLALPVWAAALRRLPGAGGPRSFLRGEAAALAGLALLGFAVQLAAAHRDLGYVLSASLLGAGFWFSIGMGLAVASVAVHREPTLCPRLQALAERSLLSWGIALAALAGLIALVPAGGIFGLIGSVTEPQPVARTVAKLLLEAILAGALVLPAVFGERGRGLPRRLLGSRALIGLGVISYSFYLLHLTITEFIASGRDPGAFSATGLNLMAHVHTARLTVLFLVSLIATAIVSTITYRLIELPFLRRKEPLSSEPR